MAKGVVFEIQGLIGFKAALEKATADVVEKVGLLMEETAKTIQDNAQAKVPVDEGDLRNAIIYTGKKLSWRVGVSGEPVPSRGGKSSHQHPHVYGSFVEFGTRNMPARSFMRAAADPELARFQDRIPSTGLVY